MTKEIVPQVAEEIVDSKNIKITPYGIEFENKPTIEEWHKAVLGVQKIHGMMQFYLGDLMVFAESPVTGWGESKYQDLIDNTGYDYQTLRHYASVARRFSPKFREAVLGRVPTSAQVSFSHFQDVQGLDDVAAKHFLEMVIDSRWSIAKLREEVYKFKNKDVVDADYEEGDNVPPLTQVTKEMVSWARTYAKEQDADMIRIQVIKGGKVIDEKTTEVY
jgi:hypothetical protein